MRLAPPTSVPLFSVSNASLRGKTWQTTVVVYAKASAFFTGSTIPFQKVYRFRGPVTFDGELKTLPALDPGVTVPSSGGWAPFYYAQFDQARVLWSVDPRRSYTVEVQPIHGGALQGGYADRGYWSVAGDPNGEGSPLANMLFSNGWDVGPNGWFTAQLPDQALVIQPLNDTYAIDSGVFFTASPGGPENVAAYFFNWSVDHGVISFVP